MSLPGGPCFGKAYFGALVDLSYHPKGEPCMARITSALTGLLLLLVFLAGSTPVAAQTNPPGEAGAPAAVADALTILQPRNLTAEMITGQVATYQLVLQASSPVTDVQVIPLDLYRSDNKTPLSASKIRVMLPENPLTM